MPATIKIKNSSTASAVPTSSDLVQGELAVNVTDKRIFTENASGTVVELGTNPTILTMGAAGSASAPVITRTGDTNTGIFFPAADTIAFAEGGVEAMRLDSSGNLGIGTTSPAVKLDVSGRAQFVNNGFNYVLVDSTVSDSYLRLAAAGTVKWYFRNNSSNSNALEITPDAGSSTGLFLNQSGNMGLGVTPSAWTSAFKAFQIGATGSLAYNGSTDVYLSNNYASIGGASKYIATAAATLYQQGSGAHAWYNAPSGTAGNAITFTQAMTLDASGNLGVGTTSPSYRLQVYNNINGTPFAWGNASRTGYLYQDADGVGITNGANTSFTNGIYLSTASNYLGLYTNGSERARINSNGDFLVGTTATDSGAKTRIVYGSGSNGLQLKDSADTSNTAFVIFQNG